MPSSGHTCNHKNVGVPAATIWQNKLILVQPTVQSLPLRAAVSQWEQHSHHTFTHACQFWPGWQLCVFQPSFVSVIYIEWSPSGTFHLRHDSDATLWNSSCRRANTATLRIHYLITYCWHFGSSHCFVAGNIPYIYVCQYSAAYSNISPRTSTGLNKTSAAGSFFHPHKPAAHLSVDY